MQNKILRTIGKYEALQYSFHMWTGGNNAKVQAFAKSPVIFQIPIMLQYLYQQNINILHLPDGHGSKLTPTIIDINQVEPERMIPLGCKWDVINTNKVLVLDRSYPMQIFEETYDQAIEAALIRLAQFIIQKIPYNELPF